MTPTSLFRSIFKSSQAGRAAKKGNQSHPGIEQLEERCLLSTTTPLVIGDNGKGFSESGKGWTGWLGGYNGEGLQYTNAKPGNASAKWNASGVVAGSYVIQVDWNASASNTGAAVYSIYDGTTLIKTVSVNQQLSPSGSSFGGVAFQTLATVPISSGTIRVVLVSQASGNLVADALLVAPTTDSAPVVTTSGPFGAATGSAITFGANVTDATPGAGVAGFTYYWNFGDGTHSTLAAPTHAYTAAGTYAVQLTVTSNLDGLTGSTTTTANITAPLAQVYDGSTAVADGSGSDGFGSTAVGTPVSKTFTVKNAGTAPLTLGPSITLPSGFTLSTGFGSTTLAAGASTTFTVRMTAAAAGSYSGTLSFTTNDTVNSPYTFTITGTATATAPTAQVFDGSTSIADGTGSDSFGSTVVGTPISKTFTVKNAGTAPLTLGSSITLPSGFTLSTGFGSTTLAAGASTTFTVQMTAAAAGSYSGTLSFTTNDTVNSPYTFTITGTATAASSGSATFVGADTTTLGSWNGVYGTQGYDIAGGSLSLPSYATVSFSGQQNYTWTASTSDTRALQNGGVRTAACWYSGTSFMMNVNLTDGAQHQLAVYAVDWENGGRSEQVQLINPATGAVLDSRIVSSFAGGEYLVWDVSGNVQVKVTDLSGPNAVLSGLFLDPVTTATPAPKAQVFDGTTAITDGSGSDGFGSTAVGTPVSKTFTVKNAGTAPLTLGPSITLPSGFTLSTGFGSTTLAAGASTTFTVQMTAAAAGSYSGTLSFTTNDTVNSPYTFTITGTATSTDLPPTVITTGPYSETTGSPISFSASVSDATPGALAAGFTYLWDFGDGSTSTLAAPVHTYAAAGSYNVQVTVTSNFDNLAGSASTTASVVTSGGAGENRSPFIVTPWDTIPNFGQNPTIYSIQSGNWSSPSTWSLGRVPQAGDVVSIDPGFTVSYDTVSTAAINTVVIQAGGSLVFRTDISTELTVINFLVLQGGDLQIGTAANPVAANVTAQVVFANVPLNTTLDPQQYGNGLIALGTVTMAGSPMSDTFVPLATEPHAGDTTLTLATAVSGWKAGDKVVLPDTHQLDWYERGANSSNYVSQEETVILAAISADGKVLTLTAPLQYDHLGARDGNGALVELPDVADLSRNVMVHSQSATGVRGYVMFTDRANVDVRDVGFYGLGRTTVSLYDNTTFDANGNVTHVGTNEQDRTPVSFHHLMGPTTTPTDGYQYTFIGNAVFCPLEPMTFRWGITLDDSHYGLVQDNVVDNWAGAGIMTEQGNESYNVIANNFVVDVDGVGGRTADDYYAGGATTGAYGRDGAGIWLSGPNNYVNNNVATDIYGGTYSYGYNLSFYQLGNIQVPLYKGADTSVAGQYVVENGNALPLLQFSGNTAYGAIQNGMTVWWLDTTDSGPNAAAPSSITNFTVWNAYLYGFYGYATNNLTLNGFTQFGNFGLLNEGNGTSTGLFFSDYLTAGMVVTNANIQGVQVGIQAPNKTNGGAFTVENSYLCDQTDLAVGSLWSVDYRADQMLPRKVVVNNVQFAAAPGFALSAIDMQYSENAGGSDNLIESDQVYVYNYNGISGDNFQVFYAAQAANFVIPQTVLNSDGTPHILGSPVSGLTNQQAWSLYGIAIAGAIAPASATTMSGIDGLVNPI